MSEKQKSGTIRLLTWPDSVLAAPEYMLGALTPEVPGKPCQAAITCIQEIISNSMDVIAENPKSKTLVVDIENYPGYVFVADDSWGIPIEMSQTFPIRRRQNSVYHHFTPVLNFLAEVNQVVHLLVVTE